MQAGRPLVQVGGFNQWRKAGRIVQKGQHSIGSIYVPAKGRKASDNDEEPDADGTRFFLVPMFDIEQTEEVQEQVLQTA